MNCLLCNIMTIINNNHVLVWLCVKVSCVCGLWGMWWNGLKGGPGGLAPLEKQKNAQLGKIQLTTPPPLKFH